MSHSKRHHYNPRYYLKQFENPAGNLWRLDKDSGKVVKGDNNSFGVKKHWNTLSSPPVNFEPDWAEKRIADIDAMGSSVVSEIASGGLPTDIGPLAAAISFMQNHQPRLKKELQETEKEKVRNWTDDYFLFVGVNTALRDWQTYIPKSFAILTIPQDSELRFLTSSNPLISFDNKPSMFFPVSSNHCLFMNNDVELAKKGSGRMLAKEEAIIGINGLVIKNSWQYVYSSREDFLPR